MDLRLTKVSLHLEAQLNLHPFDWYLTFSLLQYHIG